jgi:hypothetical protein
MPGIVLSFVFRKRPGRLPELSERCLQNTSHSPGRHPDFHGNILHFLHSSFAIFTLVHALPFAQTVRKRSTGLPGAN